MLSQPPTFGEGPPRVDVRSITPGSVTILIGENGSGKSLELRRQCVHHLLGGGRVLAVAPSIHDRFHGIRRRAFAFYGGRQGRNRARHVIGNALRLVSRGHLQVLKNVTQALAHTNFDNAIGMQLTGSVDAVFGNATFFGLPEDEQLVATVRRWQKMRDEHGIVRLQLDTHSVSEIDSASFAVLANYEKRLRDRGVTMQYFLFRGGIPIPLSEGCSGELIFITTIAFIASMIQPRSLVLIDEPETSLHPTWQKTYIETLLNLFSLQQPRIIISTHSPIIVSGAEVSEDATNISQHGPTYVYEFKNHRPHRFDYKGLGLEELYDRLFGLITPKSHYLSQRAVVMLNELGEGKRSLGDVEREIQELSARMYDPGQAKAFEAIRSMAEKIDALRQKGAE